MVSNKEIRTVLFLGPILGSYRTQYLLKYFKDNPIFSVFYVDDNFFTRKSNSFFNRLVGALIRSLTQLLYLLFADLIVVPAMTHKNLIWYKLAVFLKKNILVDFYISMYDTYVLDRETVSLESKEALAFKERDFYLMKSGNPTIFLNYTELKYYAKIADCAREQINYKIVPLCIEPRDKGSLPYLNVLSDVPVICWWGSYIPLHGLEKIIEMASNLNDRGFKFKLFLFGNNDKLAAPYIELIENKGLSSIVTVANDYTFANGRLEEFLKNTCDLSLGSFGDSEKAKKVFINKIGDSFAMSIPVLTMETDALKELINIEQDIFISLNNPENMAQKVMEIFGDVEKTLQVANNGYEKYNSVFSPKQYYKHLNEIFNIV